MVCNDWNTVKEWCESQCKCEYECEGECECEYEGKGDCRCADASANANAK